MTIRIYLLLSISFLTGSMMAQDSWDLQRCIDYAISHSISVQQADLQVQDAMIQEKMSRQAQLPSLNGGVSANANFGRSVDPTTNEFNTATFLSNGLSLNSSVTLYNGGRLKNNIKRNQLSQQIAKEDQQSMMVTVTLNVINAYFEVLAAQDNYKNAELQLKTITDQITQLDKLVAAGSRAKFELYDLRAQEASSVQQVALAQNRIDLGLLSLKGVINLGPEVEMSLETPPIDQEIYTDVDEIMFSQVYDRVLDNRPELRSLDLQMKAGEVDLSIAESALLPSINAGASVNTNFSNQAKSPTAFSTTTGDPISALIDGNPAMVAFQQTSPTAFSTVPYFNQLDNNFGYGVGLSANIPIFNNYNGKGNVQRSKIQLQNIQANKDQYLIDLRNTLGRFLTDAKAAKRNVEAAQKVLDAREVAFQNAQKRFDLGAINSFDYISIQDQLNQARTDHIIAKYDYLLKMKILDFYQGYPVAMK